MKPRVFVDNDAGYLRWIAAHRGGYVLNTYRLPSPRYLMLHRAWCFTISTPKRENWTTHQYIKLCAERREVLERWIREQVGGRLRPCELCHRRRPRIGPPKR